MGAGRSADESTIGVRKRNTSEPVTRLVPALTIVSHPMAHRVGERLLLDTVAAGYELPVSRNSPDFTRPDAVLGLPLGDPFLSRKPVVFAPGPGGAVRLLPGEGSRVMLADEPVQEPWEFSPEELAVGVPLELAERVVLLLHWADPASRDAVDALGMVGTSVGLQHVRRHIEQVADLNVPVLIRGETGSGKELIARAIHQRGARRDKVFVSVNLGAIPKELAASELFGATKGSFTGAMKDREGFFLAAHGGTLFLDEVGEAPPEVQVMLLRVLETGEIYPVGERHPVTVDVRLVAATDAHLEQQIQEGRFKAPLLHRLAGYEIRVPPLNERREDIGLLFHHFAREELEAMGEAWRLKPEDASTEPWLPAPLAARLVRYGWPGNIRQLRNLTRQLIIGSRGQPRLRLDPRLEKELTASLMARPGRPAPVPEVKQLLDPNPTPQPRSEPRPRPAPASNPAPSPKSVPDSKGPSRRKASDVTEPELLAALRESEWDYKAAADRLGIPRSSIYDLIDKNPNIRTAGDLSAEEISRCYQECGGNLDAMAQRLQVSKRALGRRINELGLGLDNP
jgi:two-component system nitrogen regulation response regulator GlnG